MLNFQQRIVKRAVDLFVSIVGLLLSCWLILLLYVISFIDTKKTGIISQKRIGYKGKFFRIYKIRTMKFVEGVYTSITVKNDPRITPFGAFLRKTKLDELPQLLNVLKGNMSLVGR